MPLYEFRCSACGHELEVLQKVSAPAPVECPACHAQALQKKLTAAGFQLKGSGWYVTDFRGGGGTAAPATGPKLEGGDAPAGSDGKSSEGMAAEGKAAVAQSSTGKAADGHGGAATTAASTAASAGTAATSGTGAATPNTPAAG